MRGAGLRDPVDWGGGGGGLACLAIGGGGGATFGGGGGFLGIFGPIFSFSSSCLQKTLTVHVNYVIRQNMCLLYSGT